MGAGMTIYQCLDCPKIKSGHPYKASGQKPWLCEACAKRVYIKEHPAPVPVVPSGVKPPLPKLGLPRIRKSGG